MSLQSTLDNLVIWADMIYVQVNYFILNVPVGDPSDKNDKAMKPIKIMLSTSSQQYNYKVAGAMDRSVNNLPRMSWKFGDAKQNAHTTLLQTEEEYDTMIERVGYKGVEERDRVAKLLAASFKKGSKSAGKSTIAQNPVEIILVQKAVAAVKGGRKVRRYAMELYGRNSSTSLHSLDMVALRHRLLLACNEHQYSDSRKISRKGTFVPWRLAPT